MARDALRARGEVTLWCLGNPRARSCPRYFLLAKMCFLIFGFRMNQRGTRADQSAPESGHQLAGTHHDRPRTHGFSALSCVLLSRFYTFSNTLSSLVFALAPLSLHSGLGVQLYHAQYLRIVRVQKSDPCVQSGLAHCLRVWHRLCVWSSRRHGPTDTEPCLDRAVRS